MILHRVHIKHYTFRELLSNNTTHIKHIILTFSESYWQRILKTFPDFISLSNNIDIFRELLPNNSTSFQDFISSNTDISQGFFHRVSSKLNYSKIFFRVHITQYWHFPGVTTKQYWLIQSSYQTVFTLSQSYYQTIVHTFCRVWMDTWTYRKFSNRKFPSKGEKS